MFAVKLIPLVRSGKPSLERKQMRATLVKI